MNYLTVEEVAEKLRVTTRTIKKMVSQGNFPPPIRLSFTNALYDEKDILAWVESRKLKENNRKYFK